MTRTLLAWIGLLLAAPAGAQPGIAGTYHYTSPLGGPQRTLLIRDPGGTGRHVGAPADNPKLVVLDVARAAGALAYSGEVRDPFDRCLGGTARVERLVAYPRSLSVEVAATCARALPGCGELQSALSGVADAKIRLRPAAELQTGDPNRREFRVDAPRLPAGTRVSVLGRLNDASGRPWCHVRAAADSAKKEPPAGWVPAAQVVATVSYTLQRQ